AALDTVTQNVYEEMSSITLLSIPLFILKGAAIGRSPAGRDLYGALHVWMSRVPGGLGIANVFACALFAAMAGSSPATCSATGSALLTDERFTLGQKFAALPRVLPFVILLTGVMIALYGGFATPSETAGLGAVLALLLIALIYNTWRPRELEPIMVNTIRESTMLM